MRILYIEDDDVTGRLVELGLKPLGFAVDRVSTAEDGLAALAGTVYDAIVLDRNLPDLDGMSVLKQLRTERNATPVLILSARGKTEERIAGLYAGADDYLAKPFELSELAARLHALGRRPPRLLDTALTCANLSYVPAELTAYIDDAPLTLPRREASVLEHLMRNAGRPVTKPMIEERLYAFGEEVASNAVEVHIHHLRKRLAAAGARVRIKTQRGIGYVLTAGTDEDD